MPKIEKKTYFTYPGSLCSADLFFIQLKIDK